MSNDSGADNKASVDRQIEAPEVRARRPVGPDAKRRTSEFPPGPLPELRRSRILDADLTSRVGNYIFTFGFPGSGKTTFHSTLMRYLMERGPFRTEISVDSDSGMTDWDTVRLINDWKTAWREGLLATANPVGEDQIREHSFSVVPLEGIRTTLNFSFLEVSGEMLQTVMPNELVDPELSRILRAFLENPKLRLVLLLMINPDVPQNDELFVNFLTFIDKTFGPGFRDRVSLGIIVSKPEQALRELKRLRQGYKMVDRLAGEYCESFVEEFAPTTYRIWDDWPNPDRTMITSLYIGEMEQRGSEWRLVSPNFESIEKIFGWVYFQFTREKLGPTRWQRLITWLRS